MATPNFKAEEWDYTDGKNDDKLEALIQRIRNMKKFWVVFDEKSDEGVLVFCGDCPKSQKQAEQISIILNNI